MVVDQYHPIPIDNVSLKPSLFPCRQFMLTLTNRHLIAFELIVSHPREFSQFVLPDKQFIYISFHGSPGQVPKHE